MLTTCLGRLPVAVACSLCDGVGCGANSGVVLSYSFARDDGGGWAICAHHVVQWIGNMPCSLPLCGGQYTAPAAESMLGIWQCGLWLQSSLLD